MLVERGFKVMNVEVVGDAYAIASNYLRKTGAIADVIATHEPSSPEAERINSALNPGGKVNVAGSVARLCASCLASCQLL